MGQSIEKEADATKITVDLYLLSPWCWIGALMYVDHTIE